MARELFEDIKTGLLEAIDFAKGTADPMTYRVSTFPAPPDLRALRERLGLTQETFATEFGIPLERIQKWECGEDIPTGMALNYLRVIEQEPDAVRRALTGAL